MALAEPAAATPQAPESVAERRLVSILFADLVGFTPFAEERDSEEVRETLTRYFDVATEVISRYGGTVEKFIGDAVMAVWGVPATHEDDAERSVRAALELVDAVDSVGPGISARAGVLTGEAAVTIGAINQGMVAGDLVNTAARLQSSAEPGTVLVGEATYRAAASAITFESVGEKTVKGKVVPIPAWRAVRVVAERGGRGRSDALEAPFVGRDDELRLVKDLFHATARESRTRLVSITGIGGIGKSRLAWEFEKYLDGVVEGVWWHRGRSPAYGEGITFWALSEMVRGRAGLSEDADESMTRSRIGALLDGMDIEAPERRWVESSLLALLAIETDVGPDALFGGWRTFFERLAATMPVVLVFEDLHWADAGTFEFIDHLLEWSRSIPLYIVTLARPELIDRRPDWGAGRRNFTSLYLEPLADESMRQLLAGLVPGLPATAGRAIVERAEGVPLYAVETVRMLVSEGRLTAAQDGTYAPTGDLTTLAVPDSLTALIGARLDGLDPADRGLVLDAAVLGQSFTIAALAAVAGTDEAGLAARLKGLIRRELFAHETDQRSPERGQYVFVQAMIREVGYNTLAKRDRKVRHLAAARFFEQAGTDEMAAALAGHYLAARDNAPDGPEADALGAQARLALNAAAERAVALGSNQQALALFEEALTVTADPADRADVLERAGEAASAAADGDAAERHFVAAIDLRRGLGDRTGAARATAALGQALSNFYRTTEAIEWLEPASAEFVDIAADPAVIALDGQLARALFLADDHRRAVDVADRVLEAAEHAGIDPIVADTLVTKGTALTWLGRPTEGVALVKAGLSLAEAIGDARTAVRASNNAAAIQSISDPRSGLATARAGLAVARRIGVRGDGMLLLTNGAECAIRTGDWPWVLAELEAALAEDQDPAIRCSLLGTVIAIDAFRGLPTADRLAEVERLVGRNTDPNLVGSHLWALNHVAFANGRWPDVRTVAHRLAEVSVQNTADAMAFSAVAALALDDRAGAATDLAALESTGQHIGAAAATRTRIRAGFAAGEGRQAGAINLYRAALRGYRDLGLVWDEALCGLEMTMFLDPSDPDVEAATQRSAETFARLGAVPFSARLDAARGVASPGDDSAIEPGGPTAIPSTGVPR